MRGSVYKRRKWICSVLAFVLVAVFGWAWLAASVGALETSVFPEGMQSSELGIPLGLSVSITLQDGSLAGAAPNSGARAARFYSSGSGSGSGNYYGQLSAESQKIYNALKEHCLDYPVGGSVSFTVSYDPPVIVDDNNEIIQNAMDAFLRDYPEVYWFSTQNSIQAATVPGASNQSAYHWIQFQLFPHSETYASDQAVIEQVAKEIANGAKSQGSDAYSQLKYAHDQLAARIDYPTGRTHRYHTIAGALVDYEAVCEGYAKAFKLVCDELGYPCQLVSGNGYSNSGSEAHMWNYVKVGGGWYAVDVTWDSNLGGSDEFFLVGRNTNCPSVGRTFGSSHEEVGNFSDRGMRFTYTTLSDGKYDRNATIDPGDNGGNGGSSDGSSDGGNGGSSDGGNGGSSDGGNGGSGDGGNGGSSDGGNGGSGDGGNGGSGDGGNGGSGDGGNGGSGDGGNGNSGNNGGSYSSGRGGSSSSGTTKVDGDLRGTASATAVSTTVTTTQAVTRSQADRAANEAISGASGNVATARLVNANIIGLDSLQSMVQTASAYNKSIIVHADTVSGNAVKFRLYVNPADATKAINLAVSDAQADMAKTKALFNKFYSNKVVVLHTGQSGGYGMIVRIAAKVPLDGMDQANLYFYSYDAANNAYHSISQPNYTIDSKGYVYFDTELGGDIVISSGILQVK